MANNQWLNQAANISINYIGSTAYIHVPANGSFNIYLNKEQQIGGSFPFNAAEWPVKFNLIDRWGECWIWSGVNTYRNIPDGRQHNGYGSKTNNNGCFHALGNNATYIGNGLMLSQNQLTTMMGLSSAPYASGDIYFNVDYPSAYEAVGPTILGREETVRSNSAYVPALITGMFCSSSHPTWGMNMNTRYGWINFHVRPESLVNNYIYNYMVCGYSEAENTSAPNVHYNKITWTNMENGYYNTTFKLRVYYNNPHGIAFNNIKNIANAFSTGSWGYRIPNGIATLQPICSDNVVNMASAYSGWTTCTGRPVCGNNVVDMINAFWYCNNLQGSPKCGPNVRYMDSAYLGCSNLTGAPACGDNVRYMYAAYANCFKLTGAPACGNNVLDFSRTYSNCTNLTGSPVCGPNVINMCSTYYNCTNLTGGVACGDNVLDMNETYYNCGKLNHTPDFGENVLILINTFYNCNNLVGYAGPSAINKAEFAISTFYNCRKLNTLTSMYMSAKNMYMTYANCTGLQSAGSALGLLWFDRYFLSSNVLYSVSNRLNGRYDYPYGGYANNIVYAYNIFGGVTNRMNVYVVRGREWDIYFHNYPNRNQFKVMNITWTDMENGYYNTAANIYVYNNMSYRNDSEAEHYGYNVMNEVDASSIYNGRADITGSPVCGDKTIKLYRTYYSCSNLTGSPACGNNVQNMDYAYYYCSNLTGSPVLGPNVIDARNTYYYCSNLTGSPVCGDHLINASGLYSGCGKLTGSPVVGNNLRSMANMYRYCNNLTGSPVFGPNVEEVTGAYAECVNLTGSFIIPNKPTGIGSLYYNCKKLTGSIDLLLNDGNHDHYTSIDSTFYGCTNLTGSPWCGPNVIYFNYTYGNCSNLTGSPVCGNNVNQMSYTYDNCFNLTGSPVCGTKVINMIGTYRNCSNLTGSPVCGSNVLSLQNAYNGCKNLTGSPALSASVKNIAGAYYGCTKLTGTVYWNYNGYQLNNNYAVAGNTSGAFGGRNLTGARINLYVANRYVFNNLRNTTNYQSLVNTTVTWNNFSTNFFFNTTHNLYVYTGASYPTNSYTATITGTGNNCLLNGSTSYSATSTTSTAKYNVSLTADGVTWRVPDPNDIKTWIRVLGAEYDYTMTSLTAATISLKNMAPDVQITANGAIKSYSVTIEGTNLLLNGSSTYTNTIDAGSGDTISLTASGDFKLPEDITLQNLNVVYDRTSDTAGTITITPTGTTQALSRTITAAIKRADLTYTAINCTASSSNPSQCTDTNYSSLQLAFTFDGTNYKCPGEESSKVSVTGATGVWHKQSDTAGYLTLTALSSNSINISVTGQSTAGSQVDITVDFSGARRSTQLAVYASDDGETKGELITTIYDTSPSGSIFVTSPYIRIEPNYFMDYPYTTTTGGVSMYQYDSYAYSVTSDGTLSVSLMWD